MIDHSISRFQRFVECLDTSNHFLKKYSPRTANRHQQMALTCHGVLAWFASFLTLPPGPFQFACGSSCRCGPFLLLLLIRFLRWPATLLLTLARRWFPSPSIGARHSADVGQLLVVFGGRPHKKKNKKKRRIREEHEKSCCLQQQGRGKIDVQVG